MLRITATICAAAKTPSGKIDIVLVSCARAMLVDDKGVMDGVGSALNVRVHKANLIKFSSRP